MEFHKTLHIPRLTSYYHSTRTVSSYLVHSG